jgi:cobalamin biosynthesis protein CobD/CbiB
MGMLSADGWEIEKIALDLVARNEMGLLEFSDPEQVISAAVESMAEHFPDWDQKHASYWVMVGAASGAAMVEKQWLNHEREIFP